MPANSSLADTCHALPASADQLQRAAEALREHAGSAHAVPTMPVTLSHVQETLDLLAAGIQRMAHAVADRCGEDGQSLDQDALPPEARALGWHLATTAKALRASREACSTSEDWSRRLLAEPLQADEASNARAGVKRRPADAMQAPDDPHIGAEVLARSAQAAEGRAAAPRLEATWWR